MHKYFWLPQVDDSIFHQIGSFAYIRFKIIQKLLFHPPQAIFSNEVLPPILWISKFKIQKCWMKGTNTLFIWISFIFAIDKIFFRSILNGLHDSAWFLEFLKMSIKKGNCCSWDVFLIRRENSGLDFPFSWFTWSCRFIFIQRTYQCFTKIMHPESAR